MTVTVDRSVEEFPTAPRKLFIGGQWTEAASGRAFETPQPGYRGYPRQRGRGGCRRHQPGGQRRP